MKKIIAVSLVFIFIVTCFAGCGKTKVDEYVYNKVDDTITYLERWLEGTDSDSDTKLHLEQANMLLEAYNKENKESENHFGNGFSQTDIFLLECKFENYLVFKNITKAELTKEVKKTLKELKQYAK